MQELARAPRRRRAERSTDARYGEDKKKNKKRGTLRKRRVSEKKKLEVGEGRSTGVLETTVKVAAGACQLRAAEWTSWDRSLAGLLVAES